MLRVFLIVLVLFIAVPAGAETPRRIVSLAPQITEILYALDLGDNIVGVTTFCDYPPEAREKPKIGGMSNPSLEAVVTLEPEIVVMTTDGNPKEFQARLETLDIKHYVFRARRISELPDAIRDVGAALGVKERADEFAAELQRTLDGFKDKKAGAPLRVLFIVWPEPLVVAGPGTAVDDAIALLGHENIAAEARLNYPKYSLEEVLRQAPDVILIGGMGQEDMRKVSVGLLDRLKNTSAVREGRVYYMGDGLFRLGPRVVDGIEEMADVLDRAYR